MSEQQAEVTSWLNRWSNGDSDALDHLMPLVYPELKKTAQAYLSGERPDHTLQPTALLNEVYLRLDGHKGQDSWRNRKQFFAFAARLMRQILVDWARRRLAEKHGAGVPHISIDGLDFEFKSPPNPEQLVDLDRALTSLEAEDSDLASLVMLRFFGGLTVVETASVLGISRAAANRRWVVAKRWLAHELEGTAAT